jgi:uncharacterized membrane protein
MLMRIIPKPWFSFWRWRSGLLALCASVWLTGCGWLLQSTYNQSPRLVHYWLDDHFDFTEAQSEQAKALLKRWLAWHRQNALPTVVTELNAWQALMAGSVDADTVCQRFERARGLTQSWFEPVVVDGAALAMSLSPKQLNHLRQTMAKRNAEWREEWLEGSANDRLKRRVKQGREWAERWYGDLSQAQLDQLRQAAQASPYSPELAFEWRKQRQGQWLGMWSRWQAQAPSPAEAQQALRDGLARWQQAPKAADQALYARIQRYNCEAVAAFHNRTTPAQRAHAVKVLQGYADDVRALMAQTP